MQEEIFGPALVVLPYDEIDRALADINMGSIRRPPAKSTPHPFSAHPAAPLH